MRLLELLTGGAVVVAAMYTQLASAAEGCKLARVAEWPVQIENGRLLIDGEINGKPIGIMLDTGAHTSLIQRAAAIRLKLDRKDTGRKFIGIGGSTVAEAAELDEFKIGHATRKNWRVYVAGEGDLGRDIAFLLGQDFFGNVDIEFDLPHRMVRLFQPVNCANTPLAYWAKGGATQAELKSDYKIDFPAKLNGQSISVQLDSGAAYSIVTTAAARDAGVTAQNKGVVSSGCAGGFGKGKIEQWIAPFDSFSVGDEAIRNAYMHVSNFWRYSVYAEIGTRILQKLDNLPDMLLGLDFLKAHRVFVSRAQERIYFTYEGGLVFPAMPWAACSDQVRAPDWNKYVEELNSLIVEEPANAKLLTARAAAYERIGKPELASADVEKALTLEPANGAAHVMRAQIRREKKDFDGALKDYDAVMSTGLRHPQLNIARGNLWIAKGDYEQGLAEFARAAELDPLDRAPFMARAAAWLAKNDEAKADAELDAMVRADPANPGALLARGDFWRRNDRFEKAIRDYDAALAMRPNHPSSLHLRALTLFYAGNMARAAPDFAVLQAVQPTPYYPLFAYVARARNGEDARATLERDADEAKLKDWPLPIYRFYLGKLDKEGLFAAAVADSAKRKDRECEANYWFAESRMIAGDTDGAKPYLVKARDDCPRGFTEYMAAKSELARAK